MRANNVNELDAKEWLKFTKSWFLHNPPPRSEKEKLHPAKFPEDLVAKFILFFTKKGDVVLDPFLGTGSTLVACGDTGRLGVGIELQERYAAIARERVKRQAEQQLLGVEGAEKKGRRLVIRGDATQIDALWKEHALPLVDFVITSPPYGPMLNKKGLAQKSREDDKLDTRYSDDVHDLGNVMDYDAFVAALAGIFKKIKKILKEGKYAVVIIQNYRDGGVYRTLAWDVGRALSGDFTLVGERLWLQDNKTLYPYGMGYSFVPNVHHHYCLIFKNV